MRKFKKEYDYEELEEREMIKFRRNTRKSSRKQKYQQMIADAYQLDSEEELQYHNY